MIFMPLIRKEVFPQKGECEGEGEGEGGGGGVCSFKFLDKVPKFLPIFMK